MHSYYHLSLNPNIFTIGSISVRWYGVMYLLGYWFSSWLANKRAKQPGSGWHTQEVSNLLITCFWGLLLGGRVGYVFFYQFNTILTDPLFLLRIWEGGMSFHGGLIGVIIAICWFARCTRRNWITIADFVAPLVPVGLGLGRLANFINGELWGRVTYLPWGIVFPKADGFPRHPSQLYEAFFEGLVLFILLNGIFYRPKCTGIISGMFMLCYGIFRFFIEYLREPDPQLAQIAQYITMGQILSLLMIIAGIVMLCKTYNQHVIANQN